MMLSSNKGLGIIIVVVAILGLAFYWYSWRPEQIRKDCYQAVLQTSDINLNYQSCLKAHGMVSEEVPVVADIKAAPKQSESTAASTYQAKLAELPPHQLACIPETKSQCGVDGCVPADPSVFVLLNQEDGGVTYYRCDQNPCDGYPSKVEISGVYMEVRTNENHGVLFKTSTLDQSYVEVLTLGTDTLVSHGHCFKK